MHSAAKSLNKEQKSVIFSMNVCVDCGSVADCLSSVHDNNINILPRPVCVITRGTCNYHVFVTQRHLLSCICNTYNQQFQTTIPDYLDD